jgi:hypothetical protein
MINSTIVSGCPRNRTTLMMWVHICALGMDRVIGDKWPQLGDARALRSMPAGPEKALARRSWKNRGKKETRRIFNRAKTMNPNGFWEIGGWVVNGITYSPDRAGLLGMLDGRVIKVVSRGLAATDPRYVGRVVHMVRHPGSVATSQEGIHNTLSRGDEAKVHSPKDYNLDSYLVAKWYLANPDTPVLVVDSDRLVEDPRAVLSEIADFESEPAIADQAHLINMKLVRSKPKDVAGAIWEDATKTHKMLLAGDWQGIADYYEQKHTATKDAVDSWLCARRGDFVNKGMCELCFRRPVVMRNFRRYADSKDIDWRSEPCAYEVARAPEEARVSITTSISNNHWSDGSERSRGLGDTIEKVAKKFKKKPCGGCKERRDRLNSLFPYRLPKGAT